MKYLFFVVLFSVSLLACEKSVSEFGEVGIRVKNNSGVDIDSLVFDVHDDNYELKTLIFTDLKNGEESDYQYLNILSYYTYNPEGSEVYFSNYFTGTINGGKIFETGFGFCGTGLFTETVTEGLFSAKILDINQQTERMTIVQMKE